MIAVAVGCVCAVAGFGLALAFAGQGRAGEAGDTILQYKQAVLANGNRPPAAGTGAEPAVNQAPAYKATSAQPQTPADQGQILTCDADGCQGIEVSFSTATFMPTTQYVYDNGQQLLAVWGGSDGNDSSRGGILVQQTSDVDGSAQAGSGTFYPSTDVGPLTITSVSGQTVSFSYTGGTGNFSLASDAFALTPN